MAITNPTPTLTQPALLSPKNLTTTNSNNNTPNKPSMSPNVSNVVLGNLHIKPWFPSFYPEECMGGRKTDWLYVCQWCFKYTPEILGFVAHCKVCPLKDEEPPGDVIYEKDDYAIYQIDGEEHKLYAQNLSLFAKLFLETKSVFFDASTFLYYTLVLKPQPTSSASGSASTSSPDTPHGQVIGFFSKEKMSWDNNNVACILVFPPWQRRGLGQILIATSYELGKREGRFGGPERPLSALGRRGYLIYWSAEIARSILGCANRKMVTIKDVSDGTWILQEDVVAALKEMDVVEKRKTAGGNIVVNKGKVRAWAEKHGVKEGVGLIDLDAFVEYEDEEG